MMVWDGECGFCHYWIIKWWIKTGNLIEYKKYQLVSANYHDIPEEKFREAVRLIMPDGKIYSGPAAAYKAYALAGKYTFLQTLYEKFTPFQLLSDWGYQKVADNRYNLFEWTKRLLGNNPRSPKNHWVSYLLALIVFLLGILSLLVFFLETKS